jgi:conjugative relaxase-like TrwC/TraI family protein
MLRLAKLTDAEYVLRQVAAGLEDYYLGYGESPGVWSGRLAATLGLDGVVVADDLRALIDRRDPASGVELTTGKETKVRAIDATFSAPKSVSLLWAFGSADVAAILSIAHVEAVEAALKFLEEHGAVTRRQQSGLRTRVKALGWAAATFVHRTSRAGDPQIHSHVVIANVVERADGTFVALDAAAAYHWAKAAGSIYQEELRRRLSERLGVGWGPDRNGCREMTGISDAQLRAFSKRTVQIEELLAAGGGVPIDAKVRMQADEAASVLTRPAKDRSISAEELRLRWAAEAEKVGLPTGEALQAAVQADRPPSPLDVSALRDLVTRLVDAELGLCRHDSSFTEAQVIEAVAAWGAGRLRLAEIEALTRAFLESEQVVRLVGDDPSGRVPGRWSTVSHRTLEDRVLDNLARLQQRQVDGLSTATVDATIVGGALGPIRYGR